MPTTPILMIPGLNATARVFQDQMETLWRFGPVTIADHRQGSTVAAIADAVLRDAPPRFALGGFSMGGYVALEIMRRAPERVTTLALIDTSARPDTPEASDNRRRGIELARAGKLDLAAAGTYPNAVHPDNVEDIGLKAIHMEMARTTGPEAYIRQQEAIISRPDSRPDLTNIKVPTMIVVGDHDKITPPDVAAEMARAIPGAWLVPIETAGHLTLLEEAQQVNTAIEAWLGE
jgi:pimeloyl-ACP methyl ester carboxylesterase